MKCRECGNAKFAARAPAVGGYYLCLYDKSPHKGNWDCNIDLKIGSRKSAGGR